MFSGPLPPPPPLEDGDYCFRLFLAEARPVFFLTFHWLRCYQAAYSPDVCPSAEIPKTTAIYPSVLCILYVGAGPFISYGVRFAAT